MILPLFLPVSPSPSVGTAASVAESRVILLHPETLFDGSRGPLLPSSSSVWFLSQWFVLFSRPCLRFQEIGPSVHPHADGLLAIAPGCTYDHVLSFSAVAPTHRLEWTSGSRLGLDLPMKIILYFNFSLLNPRCTPGRVLSGIIGERDKGLRLLVQMSNFQHRVSSKHAQTNLDCLVRERVLHYPTVVGVVERFKVLLERG